MFRTYAGRLFGGDEVHVGQEVDAHADLRVGQGLIGGVGVGRHVELDEVALVDGQDIHKVGIAAGFAGDHQLGAVAGVLIGDLHFVHIAEGGLQDSQLFGRHVVHAFDVAVGFIVSDGQIQLGRSDVVGQDGGDDLAAADAKQMVRHRNVLFRFV